MQKVLALFANPRHTDQLRLGAEDRTIHDCFRRGKMRDTIELVVRHAVTVDDLRRALLDDEFTIVHFSGHGTQAGLLFEDRGGAQYVPPQDALADLLAEYAPPLKCAVFNACYSLTQGEFTSVRLPYTVAMESPIADPAAIRFTEAFYDSIAAGKDPEFSYRQGVYALRLANDPAHVVPILLRQGETWQPSLDIIPPPQARTEATPADDRATIVGLALDVSGSMADSFDNRSTNVPSRLETVRASLGRRLDAQVVREAGAKAPTVRVFSYAFGLRSGEVCDLFSMLKAADGVMDQAEIDRLAKQHEAELRAKASSGGLGQLGGLARSLGLGPVVNAAAAEIGKNKIKNMIAEEVQRRLSARLQDIGDTTLELEDFGNFWKGSSARLADAEPLIYGNTPMCKALRAVRDRFQREFRRIPGRDRGALLLLISDGDATDGDPEAVAAEIRSLGVSIVSCYLTNVDLASPRRLTTAPGPGWPAGAVKLFNMASRLNPDTELSRYLLRQGWYVESGAACFVQVNHSEVLDEFVGLATSPALGDRDLLPRGR
jgi:hypothetical protein